MGNSPPRERGTTIVNLGNYRLTKTSALAQPFQTFGGAELYPTFAEKAARYAYGIARNHPFLDGNKRAATACMGAFLRINGFSFKPRADELLETMLGVAAGTVSYEELVGWVSRNL